MDSDKCSAQVERLEMVDTGQRRRRSEDEKFQIILEGLQTPRQISATAWRYGISRSLLIRWRRAFRAERHDAAERQIGFVLSMVTPGLGATAVPAGSASGGTVEIEFTAGVRIFGLAPSGQGDNSSSSRSTDRSSGTGVADILKQGLQSLQNSLSASYRRRLPTPAFPYSAQSVFVRN